MNSNPYDGHRFKIEYSDASLWGDVDPESEGYDEYESALAYERNVRTALEREFPGAQIEIVRGINDRLTVDDDEGCDFRLADVVAHEIGRVYQNFDAWMVEKE